MSGGTHRLFFNSLGLRSGWRLLIYSILIYTLLAGKDLLVQKTMGGLDDISRYVIGHQLLRFAVCLLVSWVMSKIEGRTIARYGLPMRSMFRGQFWQGAAVGFASLTLLLGVMWGLGIFSPGTIAPSIREGFGFGVLYGLIFIIISLSEEFCFRGYAQFTLSDGIGFWPAAVVLSSFFGYSHIGNSGETWLGALNAVLGGILFCLLLQRSGNLWVPIGFHTGWNWGQTFFYGVPNSGQVVPGHLLDSSFSGPVWLTGGSVGPEGSWLATLLLVVLFLGINRWFRDVKYLQEI